MSRSRREFIAGAVAVGAVALTPQAVRAFAASCQFRVAVINDEISDDFDHACSVAAHDFGLQWI